MGAAGCIPDRRPRAGHPFQGGNDGAGVTGNLPEAKLLLHVRSVVTKGLCQSLNLADCADAVTSGNVGTPYLVYIVAAGFAGEPAGLAGVSFDVAYDRAAGSGIDIFGWTRCADLEFKAAENWWEGPPSGNVMTWNTLTRCQMAEPTVAGIFYTYAYGPDLLDIVDHPYHGAVQVADCNAAESDVLPANRGKAGFGAPGYNPCGAPPPCSVPDSALSSLPAVLHMVPDGSIGDSIVVRCADGSPLSGVPVTLTVDPTADSRIRWTAGQAHPVISAVTDAAGRAIFSIAGGLCPQVPGAVSVVAAGVPLGTRALISPDAVNCVGQLPADLGFFEMGPHAVEQIDLEFHEGNLGTTESCSDFDGDGTVTSADVAYAATFLGNTGVPAEDWGACIPDSLPACPPEKAMDDLLLTRSWPGGSPPAPAGPLVAALLLIVEKVREAKNAFDEASGYVPNGFIPNITPSVSATCPQVGAPIHVRTGDEFKIELNVDADFGWIVFPREHSQRGTMLWIEMLENGVTKSNTLLHNVPAWRVNSRREPVIDRLGASAAAIGGIRYWIEYEAGEPGTRDLQFVVHIRGRTMFPLQPSVLSTAEAETILVQVVVEPPYESFRFKQDGGEGPIGLAHHLHQVPGLLEIVNRSTDGGEVRRPRIHHVAGTLYHDRIPPARRILGFLDTQGQPQPLVGDPPEPVRIKHLAAPHSAPCDFTAVGEYDTRTIDLDIGKTWIRALEAPIAYADLCNGVSKPGGPGFGLAEAGFPQEPFPDPWPASAAAGDSLLFSRCVTYQIADSIVVSPGGDAVRLIHLASGDTTLTVTDGTGCFTLQSVVSDSTVLEIVPGDPWQRTAQYLKLTAETFGSFPDSMLITPRPGPIVTGRVLDDLGNLLEADILWVSLSGDSTAFAGVHHGAFQLPSTDLRRTGEPMGAISIMATSAVSCLETDTLTVFFPTGADSVHLGDLVFATADSVPLVWLAGTYYGVDSTLVVTPLEGLEIELFELATGRSIGSASTDAAGGFALSAAPGSWGVRLPNAHGFGPCIESFRDTILVPACEDSLIADYYLPVGPCGFQTGVGDGDPGMPPPFLRAAPNPFAAGTVFRASLPAGMARLEIFDVTGRRVRQIWAGVVEGGEFVQSWDGRNDLGRPVGSGLYIAALTGREVRMSTRVLVLR